EWFVDGTEGSVSASQTELVLSFKDDPHAKQVIQLQGRWFPEAFGGSMGEMLRALAEDRPPATAAEDNLNSIRMAQAALRSSETGQAVELAEVV
ncbi:MAG TPA: gfo/Idh/MocA family oxidoreductase, partial [Chloroflexota bacterium]|nr:gfo/Idh/MocA family oxidoreductase [Chloroflexota bacterium]